MLGMEKHEDKRERHRDAYMSSSGRPMPAATSVLPSVESSVGSRRGVSKSAEHAFTHQAH